MARAGKEKAGREAGEWEGKEGWGGEREVGSCGR